MNSGGVKLMELPLELVLYIFQHLSIEDLHTMRVVNSKFCEIIDVPLLWEGRNISLKRIPSSKKEWKMFSSRGIKDLQLIGDCLLTSDAENEVIKLFNHCKKMQHLRTDTSIFCKIITSMIKNNQDSDLLSLTCVFGTGFCSENEATINNLNVVFPCLTSLSVIVTPRSGLDKETSVPQSFFKSCIQCKNLQDLTIDNRNLPNGYHRYLEDCFVEDLLSKLSALLCVELYNVLILPKRTPYDETNKHLANVSSPSKLKTVGICLHVHIQDWDYVENVNHLKIFTCSHKNFVNNFAELLLSFQCSLPKLETLTLIIPGPQEGCTNSDLEDLFMMLIKRFPPKIKTLYIKMQDKYIDGSRGMRIGKAFIKKIKKKCGLALETAILE